MARRHDNSDLSAAMMMPNQEDPFLRRISILQNAEHTSISSDSIEKQSSESAAAPPPKGPKRFKRYAHDLKIFSFDRVNTDRKN